ncbi:MAG: substrate-binding domain-containing protein [Bacteroidetes bacterium]|jgi:phosphate transport system substrate-binding protein|nr:substrate-binding domain-containing protein [Bacteroidota bacterium]
MRNNIFHKSEYLLITVVLLILNYGCGDALKPDLSDTPTSGNLNVSADESFAPLMNAEASTFMALYNNAKINLYYKTETEAINDLMNDSVKVIISGKEITPEQEAYFKEKKVLARSVKIAIDALALITGRNNPDSLITMKQLQEIFLGKITQWNQLNQENKSGDIAIVFDRSGSSNVRYLKEKFLSSAEFPANCFALQSNKEVMEYVKNKPNAIGIIGVGWISDSNDTTAMSFLNDIRVMSVKNEESTEYTEYYKPFQAYIALKQYPLTRDVFLINRQSRNGLGTGFASFVAGDQGQRLVRLKGLLPATMPVRIVKTGN